MDTEYISLNLGGDLAVKLELPSDLIQASQSFSIEKEIFCPLDHEITEVLMQMLRRNIPEEHRPPTVRQFQYVRQVAIGLELELDESLHSSHIACAEFLDKHIPYHSSYMDWRKSVEHSLSEALSMVRKIERGRKVVECKDNGLSESEALKSLKVKKVETLRKYYKEYAEFYNNAAVEENKTEERQRFEHLVMTIVDMKDKGKDPIHYYTWNCVMNLCDKGYEDYRIFELMVDEVN